MKFMQWNNDLITDIDLIDNQHRELFKKINSYYIKCQFNYENEATQECAKYFEQYTLFHFQTEQAFHRQYNYPLANEHEAKHDIIKIKAMHLASKLKDDNIKKDTSDEFFEFINSYINNHIYKDDMDYARFLKSIK